MKNQIIIKDGSSIVTLTSENFYITYNENTQSLKVQRSDNKPLTFKVVTEHIPGGKSLRAVQEELERDIPVFRCI